MRNLAGIVGRQAFSKVSGDADVPMAGLFNAPEHVDEPETAVHGDRFRLYRYMPCRDVVRHVTAYEDWSKCCCNRKVYVSASPAASDASLRASNVSAAESRRTEFSVGTRALLSRAGLEAPSRRPHRVRKPPADVFCCCRTCGPSGSGASGGSCRGRTARRTNGEVAAHPDARHRGRKRVAVSTLVQTGHDSREPALPVRSVRLVE